MTDERFKIWPWLVACVVLSGVVQIVYADLRATATLLFVSTYMVCVVWLNDGDQ